MVTKGPVVIIAPPGDAHALVVAERIEYRDHEVVIWDSARLPAQDFINFKLNNNGEIRIVLESSSIGQIDLSTAQSIWWRRPKSGTIPSSVLDEFIRAYCRSETDQLLRSTMSSLDIPIFNNPDAEEKSSRKGYQLKTALETGFSIPNTLITSSGSEAAKFTSETSEGIIFKSFRSPAGSQCGTQEYEQSLSDNLSLVNNSPTIFQEKISPFKDVRVSVVGRKIFAGISNSKLLDWRMDGSLTWKKHVLPEKLQSLILGIMKKLGLVMGHFDFRLTPDNDYIFLEINPSGQFLFMELDDNELEISSAVANLLIRGNPDN
jgi:RimK-like ATP-grasp domain